MSSPEFNFESKNQYNWDVKKQKNTLQAFSFKDRILNYYLADNNITLHTIADFAKLSENACYEVFKTYSTESVHFFAESFNFKPYYNNVFDPHLTELGKSVLDLKPDIKTSDIAPQLLKPDLLVTVYRSKIDLDAVDFKASSQELLDMDNNQPAFVAAPPFDKKQKSSYVLFPPQFVINARENPVEALAGIAYILSQVRDHANGMYFREDDSYTRTKARARASVAQFLNWVPEDDRIFVSERHKAMLEEYPHGTYSLKNGEQYPGLYGIKMK